MKPEEFKKLREKLGHTQQTIAIELGLSLRSIVRYENENSPIPKSVEMAMKLVKSRSKNGKGKN